MIETTTPNTARIRQLNDLLRTSFIGGRVLITTGVRAHGEAFESACVEAVQTFSRFDESNDPYGEHDFGAFDIEGVRVFWKIDYFDRSMTMGSEDPANPRITTRVLTILLANEY